MSKPIFVLVHGAWHRPIVWHPVVSELDKAGFSSVALGLPSSDPQRKHSPIPDNSEDVSKIRKAVSELVREHDVVVVMHSLGGLSGSDALEGLDKQTCASKGLKGGVIRLVFICAYLVPEGFTYPLSKETETPHTKFDHEVSPKLFLHWSHILAKMRCIQNGVATVCYEPGHEVEHARSMFYQDIDDDDKVRELAKNLEPQSIAAFWTTVPTKFAAWRYVRLKDSRHEQHLRILD